MAGSALTPEENAAVLLMTDSRRHVYDFLSRCFAKELDGEFAVAVRERFDFDCEDDELISELRAMQSCLDDTGDSALEHFAVLYNRLFFGMGPIGAKRAFPYESVYTSQKGLLMQDAYEATRLEYRMQGLERNEAFPEPDDHLAVQLAFVSWLCTPIEHAAQSGDASALEEAFSEQLRFIDNHLLNWVDRFCAELLIAAQSAACDREEGDDSPERFYMHLAKFTIFFLRFDRASVADLLS